MIIVRRCPSNVNKLQRNILSKSSPTTMSTSTIPVSTATTTSGTISGGGGQSQSFDWNYLLSSENKSKTIQLLTMDRENNAFVFPVEEAYRKAAVLIPLCYDTEGKPSILYTLRSANLNKHKGEISFPGGTMDPEDNDDPITAALRETQEEVGLSQESIDIWTTLRPFPTVSTLMGVIPVLAFIKSGPVDPKILKINPDEVDRAFTVTLEHLCDPKNWDDGSVRKFRGHTIKMPRWKNLQLFNGTEEIHLWGLTAFVSHMALSALIPSEIYKRKLPYLTLELSKTNNKDDTPKTTSNL